MRSKKYSQFDPNFFSSWLLNRESIYSNKIRVLILISYQTKSGISPIRLFGYAVINFCYINEIRIRP